jgi:hypothetical protein
MTDLLEMILAARRKGGGGWVQLLIPIAFVVVYVVSGLAKMKSGARDEDIELEKRPSLRDTEGKLRYKALDEAGARERPATPLSVQPRAKQLPYAKPSARPAAQRPAPRQPRQPAETRPAARRPQPTVQPRPARVPSHLRPQVAPPVRPRSAPATGRPRPKPKRDEPKTAPRVAQKPAAAVVSEPPAEAVRKRRTLRQDLSGSSNLQRAIIYSEILGKPLALRDM